MLVVLVGALLASALLTLSISMMEDRREVARFDRRLLAHRVSVERELASSVDAVAALGALYASSDHVTEAEFETFAQALLGRHVQVGALEWLERVPPEGREAHLAEARQAGHPDYRLWSFGLDGAAVPSPPDREVWAVRYVAPLEPNRGALGLDFASAADRREGLMKAIEERGVVATTPISLVQNPGDTVDGVLILQPVFDAATGEASGAVLAALDLKQVLRRANEALPNQDLDAWLVHGAPTGHLVLQAAGQRGPAPSRHEAGIRTELVRIPGLVLELRYWPPRRPISVVSILFAIGGVTLSLLLAWGAQVQRSRERERTRLQLERADAEAAMIRGQRLESLGLLAGGVAHDFNNLLTAILGRASLLRMRAFKENDEHIDAIELAGRRAGELVQQLLTYAGRADTHKDQVDVSSLVEELSRLVEASVGPNTVMRLDLEDDLPVVTVNATQMRQVLMNLITNAAHALRGATGEIRVRTHWEHVDESPPGTGWILGPPSPGSYVAISVSDTGCGMDAATRERMFEPFFTTSPEGRGLGLAAVLGVARESDARIHVDSVPGRGTTIRLLLAASEETTAPPSLRQASPTRSLEGVRLLLVDDEDGVREVTGALLSHAGCEVLPARDGVEALERVEQHDDGIDVVLLDLTMPRMDGRQTLTALRQRRPDLPIVLTSGYSREGVEDLLQLERTTFLRKPCGRGELVAAVHALVRGA